jgi:F0F1-type ATP synthase membrane subunit a
VTIGDDSGKTASGGSGAQHDNTDVETKYGAMDDDARLSLLYSGTSPKIFIFVIIIVIVFVFVIVIIISASDIDTMDTANHSSSPTRMPCSTGTMLHPIHINIEKKRKKTNEPKLFFGIFFYFFFFVFFFVIDGTHPINRR